MGKFVHVRTIVLAAAAAAFLASGVSAQLVDATARIPFRLTNTLTGGVTATVEAREEFETFSRTLRGGGQVDTLVINFKMIPGPNTSVLQGGRHTRVSAGATMSQARGRATINLLSPAYRNAEVSLFTINGKRVMRQNVSAAAVNNITPQYLSAGVYMLSVKGANGGRYTWRLSHGGGSLAVNVTFRQDNLLDNAVAFSQDKDNPFRVMVSAPGFIDVGYTLDVRPGVNDLQEITLRQRASQSTLGTADFTETITIGSTNVSFEMVFIRGGSFRLGCERPSGCPANTTPVDATVSPYFISRVTVTRALWEAVMTGAPCVPPQWGGNTCLNAQGSHTWYEALAFACRLSQLTGKNYRMVTEAEWEYAFKNHESSLTRTTTEEWAYNTWNTAHTGGTDPVGIRSGSHDQKTRRNAQGSGDPITGRLIRSIEGIGPALRLVVSANNELPPDYVHPCRLLAPELGAEPVNSYRDMRWVTGSNARWTGGMGITTNLMVWEDGTARMVDFMNRTITGEWFTSNNIAFVFVPRTITGGFGTPALPAPTRYAYIFLDRGTMSVIGGATGRLLKEPLETGVDKPTVANLMSGAQLASQQETDLFKYRMVDMANLPRTVSQITALHEQDSRMIDGPNSGWAQINQGSTHHYRKDVDADEFRFIVGGPGGGSSDGTMLANGSWFTVNNTFLRVIHPQGYVVDYVYVISGDNNSSFNHNSFMAYERGDFRGFTLMPNNDTRWAPCGATCEGEIQKGRPQSMYGPGGFMANVGHSTFIGAPCPASGCY